MNHSAKVGLTKEVVIARNEAICFIAADCFVPITIGTRNDVEDVCKNRKAAYGRLSALQSTIYLNQFKFGSSGKLASIAYSFPILRNTWLHNIFGLSKKVKRLSAEDTNHAFSFNSVSSCFGSQPE